MTLREEVMAKLAERYSNPAAMFEFWKLWMTVAMDREVPAEVRALAHERAKQMTGHA